MADKKISLLDPASLPLTGTEVIPIVQGGETKKVAISQLSGAVDSVNGQTGVVVLDADDVGAIPLSGTTTGNPITGDLEMEFDSYKGLVYKDEITRFGFEIGDVPRMINSDPLYTSSFSATLNSFQANSNDPAFIGITLNADYSANYTDNTLVQKKYVDTKAPLNPRVQSVTSSATVTPTSTNDIVTITAQATGLTLANPTGTFAEGQALMIRIKDNGTARAITFGSNYRAIGVTLPTTTIANKILYLGIIYDSIDAKWNILGTPQQA